MVTDRLNWIARGVLLISVIMLSGCEGLAVHDTSSLSSPNFHGPRCLALWRVSVRPVAALPDLVAMFRRRSSKGMNPTMAGIMGVFQIVSVCSGLLILSRPVIAWNMVAVVINLGSVGAYLCFAHLEKIRRGE